MSYVFQRTGSTHPLDGELRSDPRTGRPLLGMTIARPPAHGRFLTPVAPPFFLPAEREDRPRINEPTSGVRRLFVVLVVAVLAASALATGLRTLDRQYDGLGAFADSFPELAFAAVLTTVAVLAARRSRVVDIDPETSTVSIDARAGALRLHSMSAPIKDCVLRVHPVRLEGGGVWLGYGAVLWIGRGDRSALMLLAALPHPEAIEAYIRDLPPVLAALRSEPGAPLRGSAVVVHERANALDPKPARWSRGECPECGYDLLAIGYARCPECGFAFSSRTPSRPSESPPGDAG